MLVRTNDAFFAAQHVKVPWKTAVRLMAPAYDAGSEANNEETGFVPGLGGGNLRATAGSEAYVHVHAGIHEVGDLTAEADDWRNPVVEISIRPIYRDTDR